MTVSERMLEGLFVIAGEPLRMIEAQPNAVVRVAGSVVGLAWLALCLPWLALAALAGAIESAWRGQS